MALTESNMLPLGTVAPAFELLEVVSNRVNSLNQLRGEKGTVIMFICAHCPYVLHVQDEIAKIANEYTERGVSFIAISSNDAVTHPQDGPEGMRHQADTIGFNFPYLYDETQDVARAYQAACTPDFYLFDDALELVYRGRMDGSTPGNGEPVTGIELRNALETLLEVAGITPDQIPSMGCNIKWKV